MSGHLYEKIKSSGSLRFAKAAKYRMLFERKACWIFEADYALAAVYKYAPEVLKQKKQLIIYVSFFLPTHIMHF